MPAPLIEFKVNRIGVKKLPHRAGTKKWCMKMAEAVAEEAQRLAPVMTGAYQASIQPMVFHDDSGWYGCVVATDWKAMLVELGTNGIHKHRTLGTALGVTRSRKIVNRVPK